MGKVIVDITMSLDGFVTGPNDGPGNGLGDGGRILHWIRHARSDSGAIDPRATRRESLSGRLLRKRASAGGAPAPRRPAARTAALKMPTAYPLVHNYPQTAKSPGLARPHASVARI